MAKILDIVEPAELTGYVRESLNAYEKKKGSLAAWLPNVVTDDVMVRFLAGSAGLVEEAKYRAFGAAAETGTASSTRRVNLELPPLSQNIPMDEYTVLRYRAKGEDRLRDEVLKLADRAVASVADAVERMRGVVLMTGKATIDQPNFKSEDNFGRASEMAPTATQLWTNESDRKVLDDLLAWHDKYVEFNGEDPGTLLVSSRVMRLLTSAKEFRTSLADGATRPASVDEVNAILSSYGLPHVTTFDRRTASGKVLGDNHLLFLPEAVAFDDHEGTQLGATFWGPTVSASKPGWEIPDEDQPGLAAAVFEGSEPGDHLQVIADSVVLPVLANANLAMACKVA